MHAGILEPRDGEESLEAAIRRDTTLNDSQKQALVEVYRSFQRERQEQA